ncbi:MAG: hypothetical protein IKF07_03730 [Eubacterium sp.]|nr:hypothetical protein [Eubacterium sp.]
MKNLMRNSIITMTAVMVLMAVSAICYEGAYASSWPSFRGNKNNNAVGEYKTPIEQELTEPAWVKQFGDPVSGMGGWNYAPNTPIIVDGELITTSAKSIQRISISTGVVNKTGELDLAVNWGYTPLTYEQVSEDQGVIFCPLAGGCVEAVDRDSLQKIWRFNPNEKADGEYVWGMRTEQTMEDYRSTHDGQDPPAELVTEDGNVYANGTHQSVSPLVYSDGILYSGLYPGQYHFFDYFYAVATRDMQLLDPKTGAMRTYKAGELIWKYKSKGGFYWNGAVVIGDAVIVGTQDGVSNNDVTGASGGPTADSRILALDRKSGKVISEHILPNASDICSSIVYDEEGTGRIFWTTCGGFICSAAVDKETGEISDVKQVPIEGTKALTVSTPVVYNGRVYFGYTCKEAAGRLAVCRASTLNEIFHVDLPKYSKSSPLLTTAYEKDTGYLYVYMVQYNKPGGIYVIKLWNEATDASSETDVKVSELFSANGYSEYSADSLIADDSKGQLYYKNDSNSIFAVRKCDKVTLGKTTGVTAKPASTAKKVTIKWTKDKNANSYRLLYRLNETGAFKRIDLTKNKYTLTVKNPSVVTVRIMPEYKDAAKEVHGTYSDDVTAYSAKSSIKKLTAGKGAFTVKFSKHKICDGYQIQYCATKNMKYPYTVTKKGYSTVKYTVSPLMSGKTYYVRVRSYKTVGQKKVNGKWTGGTLQYGNWSTKKKVKIK